MRVFLKIVKHPKMGWFVWFPLKTTQKGVCHLEPPPAGGSQKKTPGKWNPKVFKAVVWATLSRALLQKTDCMYINVWSCICMPMYAFVLVCICIYVYIYIYIRMCICVYIYIYTYVYVYVCIFVCIYATCPCDLARVRGSEQPCLVSPSLAPIRHVTLKSVWEFGCGSKIGTPNGTLASGNMDQNLWSPGGLILTHTAHTHLWGSLDSLVHP